MIRSGLVLMLMIAMHPSSPAARAQRSSASAPPPAPSVFQHFVTRSGDRLLHVGRGFSPA